MKRFFLFLQLLAVSLPAAADHITGGELYYTLIGTQGGNYQYRITVKVFMRCNSGRQFNNPTIISVFEKGSNARVQDREVPLARTETLRLTDPNKCITDPPVVCYEVGYYEFTTVLPPSASGYVVASQFVFRIAGIRNLVPFYSNVGTTYSGEIPGTAVAGAPANNSARFVGSDLVAICAENAFSYSFAATDADGDELRYSFCDAFQGGAFRMGAPVAPSPPPYQPVPYGDTYSGTAPLGSRVRIDSRTGLITGVAPADGIYVVTVCVEEIRNGKVIAVQRKDLQIFIADCTIAAATLEPAYDLCDSSLNLSVSNQSTSPLIRTYNWELTDRSGGVIAHSAQSAFDHAFVDTGLYQLKLVVNRNGTCADSNDALVRVYPGLKPTFDFEGLCAGKPTRFRDGTTTVYGRITSWQWDFDQQDGIGSADDGAPEIIHIYPNEGIRQVRLTVTNANGCTSQAQRTIAVVNKPPLDLPFRDTTICINDQLQLKASGAGVIRWTPLTGMNSPDAAEPVVQPQSTTTYYAQINDNGCLNTDSLLVRVERTVRLQPMDDTTVCAGDTIRLRLASNALKYAWEPASSLAITNIREPFATASATTTYRVTGQIGGCTATASINVTTIPYPKSNAGPDTTICFNTTCTLQGSITGSSFNWSSPQTLATPGSLQTLARPPATMAYVLTVFDNLGCPKPVRDTMVVQVLPPVVAEAGRDTSVVIGQALQLQASGGSRYQWTPGTQLSATNIANPVALYSSEYNGDIRYRVQVFTPEGCTDTASVLVRVYATSPSIFVPTAFTPNGDGLNDLLRPVAAGMQRVEQFSVFNRWGQLLYSDRVGRGWDGRINGQLQQSGIYVWMVKAVDFRGRAIVQKGTVALVR